jgi:hypothetical protein
VIFNAAYLPKHAPTSVAVLILVVAAALEATNLFLVSRIENFAWDRFKQVAGWFLLAYAVIAGMIEYAFIYDHTRGTQLVILTLMLVLFMLNVPVLAAFTVARYERV